MTVILEAKGLSYKTSGRALISDVDLSIRSGSFAIVIGPNGAGKSTLLRMLCGELAPTSGQVVFEGRDLKSIAPWRLAHCRAVMPQASELNFPFRAFEVAAMGVEGIGRGLSRTDRRRFVVAALDRADVGHLAHRNYQTLSGGERQRVHFARILAQLEAGRTVEPRQIFFLDEPIASLDLKHQLAVLEHARSLARGGLAVVAVLHDLQLAAGMGDELVLVHEGRLAARGVPADVLSPGRLADIFGVSATAGEIPDNPWRLAASHTPAAARAQN